VVVMAALVVACRTISAVVVNPDTDPFTQGMTLPWPLQSQAACPAQQKAALGDLRQSMPWGWSGSWSPRACLSEMLCAQPWPSAHYTAFASAVGPLCFGNDEGTQDTQLCVSCGAFRCRPGPRDTLSHQHCGILQECSVLWFAQILAPVVSSQTTNKSMKIHQCEVCRQDTP
jgi:hypothetical protein